MESAVTFFEALTAFAIFTVVVLFGILLAITIQIALVVRSLMRKLDRYGENALRRAERLGSSFGDGGGILASVMFLARQWRKRSRTRRSTDESD